MRIINGSSFVIPPQLARAETMETCFKPSTKMLIH